MTAADRRRFLTHAVSASALAATGVGLSGCGGGGGGAGDAAGTGASGGTTGGTPGGTSGGSGAGTGTGNTTGTSPAAPSPAPEFLYGVASGDPLADRVILWTHARGRDSDSAVDLEWEVATDTSFAAPVSRGRVTATRETGFTVKVDATGLQAGTEYVFRFRSGSTASPVGRTRTLPTGALATLRLAVMSCSNFSYGYFHALAAAAASDAQFAVLLGDTIYEYGADVYAFTSAAALGRLPEPRHEVLTLDDYRARYRQVRSDPDAQALHARMPVLAVWDDHELANNAWRDGAQNHSPDTEGAFSSRRAVAQQAFHEWLPIRTGADRGTLYRSVHFGDLVSLHLLDTRLAGRDPQLASAGLLDPATAVQAQAALLAPERQLLGSAQQQWLQSALSQSTATWQVLGQQVLMARLEFPASVLQALQSASTSPLGQAAALSAVSAYVTARRKQTAGAALTAEEAALLDPRLNPKLGYNLDAWDGYPAAREAVLTTALQLRKRLVVLAGDSHNAWHSALTLKGLVPGGPPAGTIVGEEFATPSVTSPGFEESLSAVPTAQLEALFAGLLDDLRWMDASRRGFLKMSFTPTEARGEWVFVSSVKTAGYTATVGHTAVMAA